LSLYPPRSNLLQADWCRIDRPQSRWLDIWKTDHGWDAIENTPAQAENKKLRSTLMMALKDHIARTGLSQSEATKLLGITQPRISDLKRGKIELFDLDTLVNMIGAAGLHVEMRISDAA
jgi:predicted XRE-type DNA-binding protein